MGLTEVNGLPVHVLVVHAVVVLVPAAAVAACVMAWWRRPPHWLAVTTVLLALAAATSVPVAMRAGQWLKERVFVTDLVARHTALGRQLWPWTTGLALSVLAVWYLRSRTTRHGRLALVAAVLTTAVAVGASVQVVRIGESGSRAVWQGSFTAEPRQSPQR